MDILQGVLVVDLLTPSDPALGPDETCAAFLTAGRLAYQRCGACDVAVFPPRAACPACGAEALSWCASAGVGEVHAASTISPRGDEPYCVALVDVAEGFRMMANVIGAPPDHVAIGQPVQAHIIDGDGGPLPCFEVVR